MIKAYRVKFYTVEKVQSNPQLLFVYGDNLQRYGKKGQAVIRDLPNTLGISTKYKPTMDEDAFFSDKEVEFSIIDNEIRRLREAFREGAYTGLVFPSDGLGTGLAELPRRSPKLLDYLNSRLVDFIKTELPAL